MAKLIILYGNPEDPQAFEDYYLNTHLPFAGERMPNVRGAETIRVLRTLDGEPSAYHRVTELSYDSLEDLQSGLASADGKAVLADLDNFATGGATLLVADD